MAGSEGSIRRPKAGFTVVELLVVMGILGVLIGILIPVISRAQAASKATSCLLTLGNIGKAFQLYAQDNKMTLPDPGGVGLSWEQLLQPYFKAPFKCPADEEMYPSVGSSYDWRDTPDGDTTLAGSSVVSITRSDLVLAFEALSGWHRKHKINVVRLDGAAITMDEEACMADLNMQVDPSIPIGMRKR